MKKSWLYSAIAGFTLLATACGNNNAAGPGYTNGNNTGTTRTQSIAGNGYGTYGGPGAGYANRGFVGNYTGTTSGAPGVTGYSAGNTGTHFGWNTGTNRTNQFGAGTGYGTTGGTTATGGTTGYGGTGYTTGYGTGANNTAFGTDRTDGYYGTTSNNAGFGGLRNNFNVFGDGDRNGNRNNTYYGPLSVYRNRGMGTLGANNVSNIGYANISSTNLRSNAVNQVYVDRDALARAVGNVTASVPNVRTSTVLVTDEEIFVGLMTRGTDTKATKNKARMNAMSVSPRYYKVYVTDNQRMISEMSRIASRTSNVNANTTQDQRSIDSLIRSFGGEVDGEEPMYGADGSATRTRGTTGTTGTMTGTSGSRTSTTGTGTTSR
ncbi:YhcN/YlaJ family sporulation lipoprotein [Brevibacillus migulae]|uniref:YhcN/YlaJ family sporulation lipoprotein n=1 Tax=Brevibacillus migulae TaxID=1644114 RepID=UPI00106E01DA|nr:YhcN/YlaJ family sporulation lipoprotein [Brevibacillus migulae]